MTTVYGATATRIRNGWLLRIPILNHLERIEHREQVEPTARQLIARLGDVSVEWIGDASPTA